VTVPTGVVPATLAPLIVSGRDDRVRAALSTHGAEALVVSSLTNVRWLTGFTGSAGRAVVLPDEVVLITDGRYGDQAADQLTTAGAAARVVVGRSAGAQDQLLVDLVRDVGVVGLEAAHVSWADQRRYAQLVPGVELVPTAGVVEGERVVKDPAEVARIEAAAAIASAALAAVYDQLFGEPSERAFALALDTEMRRLGADGPSFDTIVASGPNSALPHHRPGARRIVAGDLVVLDFGALVDGYHSDMTRTAVVGDPTDEQAELLAVVTEAQALGVAAVRAGVAAAEVDLACRERIEAAGWGDQFTHGTGHGVGLLIHEAPWLNAASTEVLAEGSVVTVEPGVYRVPSGGARVEDSVLVTAEGCRPLTPTPKDLSCLRSPRTT
jgi:Xaa-Pro aminopeptidase